MFLEEGKMLEYAIPNDWVCYKYLKGDEKIEKKFVHVANGVTSYIRIQCMFR